MGRIAIMGIAAFSLTRRMKFFRGPPATSTVHVGLQMEFMVPRAEARPIASSWVEWHHLSVTRRRLQSIIYINQVTSQIANCSISKSCRLWSRACAGRSYKFFRTYPLHLRVARVRMIVVQRRRYRPTTRPRA